jgi:hypothetical protein
MPRGFATTTRAWWAESIRADNVIRLPYPLAQSAPVHEKDIAAFAVNSRRMPRRPTRGMTARS